MKLTGQPDGTRRALDERASEPPLELTELVGESWLGDVARVCGLAEVPVLGK